MDKDTRNAILLIAAIFIISTVMAVLILIFQQSPSGKTMAIPNKRLASYSLNAFILTMLTMLSGSSS